MLSARHDKPVNQAFCGVRKCYLVKLPEFGASLLILKRDPRRWSLQRSDNYAKIVMLDAV